MSLRDDAITHMGEAVYPKEAGGLVVATGSATLDALLDFLGAHTEEWSVDGVIDDESVMLLVALRGTTEEQ